MKIKNFVSMVLGVLGGCSFSLGMCMCLLPQWDAFQPGLIAGAAGLVLLLAILPVRRVMEGKAPIRLNPRTLLLTAFGVVSCLFFGLGLSFVMVWGLLLPGIAAGLFGIVMLLCLVPMCLGLKKD